MSTAKLNLNDLSKEQLIELVELLLARVSTLEQAAARRAASDKPEVKKTSVNSSTPPSRDRKANRRVSGGKPGAKPGHRGSSRQRSEVDEVLDCRLSTCPDCGHDLSDQAHWLVGRHQVVDLPRLRAVVREARRYRTRCPGCRQEQTSAYPVGFEKGRMFGPQLEQLVLYLHCAHPLSYERVQQVLDNLCGVKLSQGALVALVHRTQARVQRAAATIQQQLRRATVVGSDETGARVGGRNYWQWVFQTDQLVYHVIRPSRAAQVMHDVMGPAQPTVWVSDVFSAQLRHPAHSYQICLAHQLRDLQYAHDTHGCAWAQAVQHVLEDAIGLHRQRPTLTTDSLAQQRQQLNQRLDRLLAEPPGFVESERLRARFLKHRAALLLFLARDDVPPTNNASEQALRNSVIYRKVTGGFRSTWAADLYAQVLSILQTGQRQGHTAFDALALVLSGHALFPSPHSL